MRPRSPEELAEAIREANRTRTRLLPRCLGSKDGVGPPAQYDEVLDLSALPRRVEVDDEEMTVRASASTPLAELREELARRGKRLALDPPLFSRSSVGGLLATNLYGPMAHRYMTPRDQLLSLKAVTGAGAEVRLGAPVMKDVAGYNLKRLVAGSWGTLAVVTEAVLRIYGMPEEVAVAAVEPRPLAELRRLMPTAALESGGRLYLRFEGNRAEVEYRLARAGKAEAHYGREAEGLWGRLTEGEEVFSAPTLWKVAAPPAQLPPAPLGVPHLRYPLLGVMYVAGEPPQGGRALRLKPPERWDIPNRDLMEKVKRAFDPNGVLAPGRLP